MAAAYSQIGRLLHKQGDLDAAERTFRELINGATPETEFLLPSVYVYYGDVRRDAGDDNAARAAWKEAVRRDRAGLAAEEARKRLEANT